MEIIVCIKQVPETTNVDWDPKTGAIVREGVSGVLNPNDKNVLEAALQLKEKHGSVITAVSMGPEQAEEALREALSMGVDKAVLLSDKRFSGADTLATSYTLSCALRKIAGFDLILCGKESADGVTGHVGPQLAEFLNVPQLTYATEIAVHDHTVRIKQKLEDCHRILEAPLPALVTVGQGCNQPRTPSMDQIMEAFQEKEVVLWTAEDLDANSEHLGLNGSPTQTRKVYLHKIERGETQYLEGQAEEMARKLMDVLKQENLL
jgi:electron transfer flavoprotein beta subunit